MEAALKTGKYGFITSAGRFGLWGKPAPKTKNAQRPPLAVGSLSRPPDRDSGA